MNNIYRLGDTDCRQQQLQRLLWTMPRKNNRDCDLEVNIRQDTCYNIVAFPNSKYEEHSLIWFMRPVLLSCLFRWQCWYNVSLHEGRMSNLKIKIIRLPKGLWPVTYVLRHKKIKFLLITLNKMSDHFRVKRELIETSSSYL